MKSSLQRQESSIEQAARHASDYLGQPQRRLSMVRAIDVKCAGGNMIHFFEFEVKDANPGRRVVVSATHGANNLISEVSVGGDPATVARQELIEYCKQSGCTSNSCAVKIAREIALKT